MSNKNNTKGGVASNVFLSCKNPWNFTGAPPNLAANSAHPRYNFGGKGSDNIHEYKYGRVDKTQGYILVINAKIDECNGIYHFDDKNNSIYANNYTKKCSKKDHFLKCSPSKGIKVVPRIRKCIDENRPWWLGQDTTKIESPKNDQHIADLRWKLIQNTKKRIENGENDVRFVATAVKSEMNLKKTKQQSLESNSKQEAKAEAKTVATSKTDDTYTQVPDIFAELGLLGDEGSGNIESIDVDINVNNYNNENRGAESRLSREASRSMSISMSDDVLQLESLVNFDGFNIPNINNTGDDKYQVSEEEKKYYQYLMDIKSFEYKYLYKFDDCTDCNENEIHWNNRRLINADVNGFGLEESTITENKDNENINKDDKKLENEENKENKENKISKNKENDNVTVDTDDRPYYFFIRNFSYHPKLYPDLVQFIPKSYEQKDISNKKVKLLNEYFDGIEQLSNMIIYDFLFDENCIHRNITHLLYDIEGKNETWYGHSFLCDKCEKVFTINEIDNKNISEQISFISRVKRSFGIERNGRKWSHRNRYHSFKIKKFIFDENYDTMTHIYNGKKNIIIYANDSCILHNISANYDQEINLKQQKEKENQEEKQKRMDNYVIGELKPNEKIFVYFDYKMKQHKESSKYDLLVAIRMSNGIVGYGIISEGDLSNLTMAYDKVEKFILDNNIVISNVRVENNHNPIDRIKFSLSPWLT